MDRYRSRFSQSLLLAWRRWDALAERSGNQRPNLVTASAVYGYRPPSWRSDRHQRDWRVFGELVRERWHFAARQIFVGPTVLEIFNYFAISSGVQFLRTWAGRGIISSGLLRARRYELPRPAEGDWARPGRTGMHCRQSPYLAERSRRPVPRRLEKRQGFEPYADLL